jgi:hypothetical protein
MSIFYTEKSFLSPGRNLTVQNGKSLKDSITNCPQNIVYISEQDVKDKLSKLKHVEINSRKPVSNQNQTLMELNNIFEIGISEYFSKLKKNK